MFAIFALVCTRSVRMPASAPVSEMARPPRALTAIAIERARGRVRRWRARRSSSRCGRLRRNVSRASLIRLSVTPAMAEMTATTRQPSRCVSMRRRATSRIRSGVADGSAAIFLNDQAHRYIAVIEVRSWSETRQTRSFAMLWRRCQTRSRRTRASRKTSDSFGATGFSFVKIHADTISGSFNPWPVTRANDSVASQSWRTNRGVRLASQHLKSPAMGAALAGSTKIPSCLREPSLRFQNFFVGHDVNRAAGFVHWRVCAASQLAGFPMRMADATVSGFSITSSMKISARRPLPGLQSSRELASIFRARWYSRYPAQ